jgi:hypothetical protein
MTAVLLFFHPNSSSVPNMEAELLIFESVLDWKQNIAPQDRETDRQTDRQTDRDRRTVRI